MVEPVHLTRRPPPTEEPRTIEEHFARAGYQATTWISGSLIGTTSDVYALGVILYELMTGHRPYRLRSQVITEIHRTAVDPKTKLPHPVQRLELALEESRYPVDPFKAVHAQVKEAVKRLRPLIPLSFETVRLAMKVPGKAYGSVHQLVRSDLKREEWLENGAWACVIEIPAGMKGEIISQVASRAPDVEIREL